MYTASTEGYTSLFTFEYTLLFHVPHFQTYSCSCTESFEEIRALLSLITAVYFNGSYLLSAQACITEILAPSQARSLELSWVQIWFLQCKILSRDYLEGINPKEISSYCHQSYHQILWNCASFMIKVSPKYTTAQSILVNNNSKGMEKTKLSAFAFYLIQLITW